MSTRLSFVPAAIDKNVERRKTNRIADKMIFSKSRAPPFDKIFLSSHVLLPGVNQIDQKINKIKFGTEIVLE